MIGNLTNKQLYPQHEERFGVGDIIENEFQQQYMIVYTWENHCIRLINMSPTTYFGKTHSRFGQNFTDLEDVQRGWTLEELSSWYGGLTVVEGYHRMGATRA